MSQDHAFDFDLAGGIARRLAPGGRELIDKLVENSKKLTTPPAPQSGETVAGGDTPSSLPIPKPSSSLTPLGSLDERLLGTLDADGKAIPRDPRASTNDKPALSSDVSGKYSSNELPQSLKQSDLGEKIGSGGEKDVFAYGDKYVVGVPRDVKTDIDNEYITLKKLQADGLPVVNAKKVIVDGKDALLYDRYQGGGSKDLVKTIGNNPKIIGREKAHLLNERSIRDLEEIKRIMIEKNIWVDDLQFLIGKDGSIVVADPLGSDHSGPSKKNLKTIEKLLELARENLQ